ncbi:hypothetical protein PF005_g2733 [Phytophthora fragariae]|uniref:Reverse transcriptase domain-containing protein n=1 Tax=Phytophthora fragariae TaxID=53985 RepID=A0A6A3UP79_9STRA|nr:hypothetical protein PF003_g20033 [Phytophthora fragariae]KAE8947660.1 hypothetical protein PF009_g2733 [Phytophthora fragariae]KAE9027231.1 hypothetical protein PF011_g2131 [Phytophthora fragariae]KAE9135406.1 hypothetical protein PF007_g2561 [Phytophthora fragariae]KAE9153589.1 hypothetical protein PF006_g2290 [Phytophthora fragariae]
MIDLEENTLTLKGTGEVFPLGTPRVEEMHSTRISSTVCLRPGGQALVVTDVQGKAPEDATVQIEGLQEVDATVRVARTLYTVHDGKVLVEVCNASAEEVTIRKGTLLAAATVVPETAFASSASTDGGKLGHIRPSTSPWASPVLMIRKPDGGIRFCIDYRRLNAVTIKDCYPMPLIDDILDVLGKAKLFSTMDIASGYWNVPIYGCRQC